jgi:hypothetical protein
MLSNIRTAEETRSNLSRARDVFVNGLHSLIVANDYGGAGINDQLPGTSKSFLIEI